MNRLELYNDVMEVAEVYAWLYWENDQGRASVAAELDKEFNDAMNEFIDKYAPKDDNASL